MSNDEHIKRMAYLLKSGATMLEDHCPECDSPLFKIKGDIWCPRCNKRVITVKEGEESLMSMTSLLSDIEKTTLTKIQDISKQIMEERDIANLERLCGLLVKLLEALEKTRRIQKI